MRERALRTCRRCENPGPDAGFAGALFVFRVLNRDEWNPCGVGVFVSCRWIIRSKWEDAITQNSAGGYGKEDCEGMEPRPRDVKKEKSNEREKRKE